LKAFLVIRTSPCMGPAYSMHRPGLIPPQHSLQIEVNQPFFALHRSLQGLEMVRMLAFLLMLFKVRLGLRLDMAREMKLYKEQEGMWALPSLAPS
jgi:hypothetical protein